MRAGLSAIQQTLTPEAASVLNQSIAEAAGRNHGQTTPLHVAATLLAAPTGYLRQACIRSHPNSSHPLQCRALELCFSVALERLPTTAQAAASASSPSSVASSEPPISNALMAALKRAQAHQRRGCPELLQQPLLAVKVELEQLIISILDDPSVSRVMREASFSSPAVKAAIEQSLMSSSSTSQANILASSRSSSSPSPSSPAVSHGPKISLGFRAGFGPRPGLCPTPSPMAGLSMYLNPRLQQHQQRTISAPSGQSREDDVRKVIEILSRTRKKNPVLVGESEPEAVMREVLRRVKNKELGVESPLSNVEVVSVEEDIGVGERTEMALKLTKLGGLIERKMMVIGGVRNGLILDLGDLKWLLDQPPSLVISSPANQQGVSEVARAAVVEMGKILGRFGGEGGGVWRLWVIGTATCETYLRCQVYHPTMENEWDLQAVSIAARAPLSGKFTRLGTNGLLSGSLESASPSKSFPSAAQSLMTSEGSFPQNLDPSRRPSCCPQCMENYKQEVSKLSSEQSEHSVSDVKMEAARHQMPQWLQNAKFSDQSQGEEHHTIWKQKSNELLKKWSERCLQLHPSFHKNGTVESVKPTPIPVTGLYTNPLLVTRQALYPKSSVQPKNLGNDLRLETRSFSTQTVAGEETSPRSPVRTDLVLGQTKTKEPNTIAKAHEERVKDFLSCVPSDTESNANEPLQSEKPVMSADTDSFKRILKGLTEKVWWQKEAASAVAATVTQCKTGNRRKRAGGAKGDSWLLFFGPDRTGKKKLAMALSELVCGVSPVMICLGSRRDCEESEISFRGKTVLDSIAEAIRRNPFSVIMLQDIDEADMLLRGSIKQAMERGRFADSYGREISLGNIIFILTVSNGKRSLSSIISDELDEEKLAVVASGGWQLRISVGDRRGGKRHPSWLTDDEADRVSKQRRETGPLSLSFDLNQLADADEDRLDGSHHSSDLTVEHEDEKGPHENMYLPPLTISSASRELLGLVDGAIMFKPVDFGPIRKTVERTIKTRIRTIIGEKTSVSIEDEALEKVLGGSWLGQMGLDSWVEKVLVPSLHKLKSSVPGMGVGPSEGSMVVRLEMDEESESRSCGDWLPLRVSVRVGSNY